jgi:hypothetical protein
MKNIELSKLYTIQAGNNHNMPAVNSCTYYTALVANLDLITGSLALLNPRPTLVSVISGVTCIAKGITLRVRANKAYAELTLVNADHSFEHEEPAATI